MNGLKKYVFMLMIGLAGTACETEMIDRPNELAFETGGYMRTVTPFPVAASTFSVRKSNMAGTNMTAVLEAVTPNQGAKFASYELVVRYVNAAGTVVKPDAPLRTLQASQFAKDPTTNYPRFTLVITGKELQDALKMTDAEVVAGGRYEVRATMVLTDGKRFDANNTGVNITGGAFYSSPFFYRINVVA